MIINTIKPNIESFGDFEEKLFSAEDQGMVFEILRSKLYSNPILAVCREISCNALDAHREIDKADISIEISLPNSIEPFLKIKDYGPGISPDRVENIYIKYTASTKRSDNKLIGGMGLGSKSTFSVTDSFSVITNFNGKRYNYCCYIDETKIGKLILLSEAETKESNGTEIIIPVKRTDFTLFRDGIEQSTRYWKVKPLIKGDDCFEYKIPKILLEGSNWNLEENPSWNKEVKLIIDSIQYPLDVKSFNDSLKLINNLRGNLCLYFNTGEISLSASREQIYLDKRTIQVISDRFRTVNLEMKDQVIKKANSFPNLWDANVFYKNDIYKGYSDLSMFGEVRWNGILLKSDSYHSAPLNTLIFKKGDRYNRNPNRIIRNKCSTLGFEKDSMLIVNDLGIKDVKSVQLRPIFEKHTDIKCIYLVNGDKDFIEKLNMTIHLDKMNPKYLSNYLKAPTKRNATSSRTLIFKFDKVISGFKLDSMAAIVEDTNNKVFCYLMSDSKGNRSALINGKVIQNTTFRSITNNNESCSFYGVDRDLPKDKVEKLFKGFENIDSFINDKILSSEKDFVKIKYIIRNGRELNKSWFDHGTAQHIINSNSLFLKKLKLLSELSEVSGKDNDLLYFYEQIKGEITEDQLDKFILENPEYNIEIMNKSFNEKYPILDMLTYYDYRYKSDDTAKKKITDYVNLIDSKDVK